MTLNPYEALPKLKLYSSLLMSRYWPQSEALLATSWRTFRALRQPWKAQAPSWPLYPWSLDKNPWKRALSLSTWQIALAEQSQIFMSLSQRLWDGCTAALSYTPFASRAELQAVQESLAALQTRSHAPVPRGPANN